MGGFRTPAPAHTYCFTRPASENLHQPCPRDPNEHIPKADGLVNNLTFGIVTQLPDLAIAISLVAPTGISATVPSFLAGLGETAQPATPVPRRRHKTRMPYVAQYCDTLPNRPQKMPILVDLVFVVRPSIPISANSRGPEIRDIARGVAKVSHRRQDVLAHADRNFKPVGETGWRI